MKKFILAIFTLAIILTLISCENNTNNKKTVPQSTNLKSDVVEVYYFHGTRRCVTCAAVGDVAEKLVETKYSDNPKVKFIEINIDEDAPGVKELAEKFMVTGSGLYVYNGEKIENITAYAFQKDISAPDQLEKKLIELINSNL